MDPENSYIAIKWQFLFNLRERVRDATSPNLLVYYSMGGTGGGRVIGAQADNHQVISQQWGEMKEYFEWAAKLKEFVEIERATNKLIHHQEYHNYIQRFFN